MTEIDVPDWVVDEALDAYKASRGTYEGEVPADADDMRAALTAALGAWVAQRGTTYHDIHDSSLPIQVDWDNQEPEANTNVVALRQEKPE